LARGGNLDLKGMTARHRQSERIATMRRHGNFCTNGSRLPKGVVRMLLGFGLVDSL
jgi:hypothetical protein